MNRIAAVIVRYPKQMVLGCSLVTLVVAFGITRLETRNNYKGNLPASDPIVQTNAHFEEVFGDEQIMLVAVEDTRSLSPSALTKVRLISDSLSTVEGVPEGGVTSLATLSVFQGDGESHSFQSSGGLEERIPASARRRLISADGSTALIVVRIARTARQAVVANQTRRIIRQFEGPERIYAIGDWIVAQDMDEGIQSDLRTLLPLALVLILFGFFASFRDLRGVVLPLLVILGSIVWTLGLMGWPRIPLNVVTSTIPIILVATASSYGIHVIHGYNIEVRSGEAAVRRLLDRIGRPILLTGLTSGIGMLTLLLFRITPIREFGLFAAVGILSAMVMALVFVPSVLSLLSPSRRHLHPNPEKRVPTDVLLRLGLLPLKHRRLVLGFLLLFVAVSVAGTMRIRLGIDPVELFPEHHPFQAAARVFNTQFSGWRYFNIMIEGPEAGSVMSSEFLDSMGAFQRAASRLQKVGSTRSIVDALQEIHPVLPSEMSVSFAIPDSPQDLQDTFRRYTESYGARKESLWVDGELRRARITVTITTSDHEEQQDLYHHLRDLARTHFSGNYRVEFGGTALLWIAGNHYVAIGKIYNIVAAMLLVFLFCALAFWSGSNGLLCVIPLSVAMLCTFGVMGFCGIRLNMATAIITSIGVGIGVDFAIHFLSRFQEERAEGHGVEEATANTLSTAGRAICYDAASNVLGFIVFTFSGFSPIQNLGWLVSLAMVMCALSTLLLLPSLAAIFGAGRIGGRH